mmetsp:Transcript_11854/g.16411  ORF Transcript_11854/g.16411 Transcript_11854/m.16411 type:complete len:125 (+) Transcript_11854:226-600(+)
MLMINCPTTSSFICVMQKRSPWLEHTMDQLFVNHNVQLEHFLRRQRTRFTGFSAHAAPPAASMRQEHSVDLFNIRFSPPVVIRPDCSWRRTLEIAGRNHFSELEWDVEFACQDAAGEAGSPCCS